MTEYKIGYRKTFSYIPHSDTTMVGMQDFKFLLKKPTDNEISEYVSDCFIHENIHKVLNQLFNNIVSKLFDGIEYLFRNDELHEKFLTTQNGRTRMTYQTFIKRNGFQKLLNHYGITKQDITDASILCHTRKDASEWVEIFGVPRHKQIEGIEPDDIIRIYPNHVIVKIEVV